MIASIGIWGLITISSVIILFFSGMFFFILKKKRQSKASLSAFSRDVRNMLDKIADPKGKIRALKQLVERIETDEKYGKTPDWKNSVLAKVYEHMAAVYYGIGEESGVIEACTKIITLDPGDGMSFYNRGSIYNNREEYEKAVKDFNDAILLMPDYASTYNNRGLALDKLGQYDDALSDFNYAIELENSGIAYYNRANLYFENEKYVEAREDYQKYMELDGDNDPELKTYVEAAIDLIDKKLKENNG